MKKIAAASILALVAAQAMGQITIDRWKFFAYREERGSSMIVPSIQLLSRERCPRPAHDGNWRAAKWVVFEGAVPLPQPESCWKRDGQTISICSMQNRRCLKDREPCESETVKFEWCIRAHQAEFVDTSTLPRSAF